ncbi:hypothetical protein T4D_619 [Trichinella pseudospiralis]|uniref:Uncharacterized protein n=1 Tax=Trichinella pseudospiralis TaxID=6337 RepID=A0A0V1FSW9_TRIPS|nr:hypothetical protein T4D_619 [Trichinella pseudospiralis]
MLRYYFVPYVIIYNGRFHHYLWRREEKNKCEQSSNTILAGYLIAFHIRQLDVRLYCGLACCLLGGQSLLIVIHDLLCIFCHDILLSS